MNHKEVNRNLWAYGAFVLFNEKLFWGSILILSLQQLAHMSLSEIYFMESAILCLCVALDIPFGVLADLVGRKKVLIVARLFLFASAVCFTTMTSPLMAWVGNVLWAIGFTLQSGPDKALLQETLHAGGRGDYMKVEGRMMAGQLWLIATCSLVTGWLAEIDLRLPLWIGLPFMLIPLIAAFYFKETKGAGDRVPSATRVNALVILKQSGMFVLRSAEVRWVVGFAAILAATAKTGFFTYNPYFELVALPLPYYGVIFFCLNVVAGVASWYAHNIESRLGERKCIMLMVLCTSIPFILMASVPMQAFAYLVIIQNVTRGMTKPFVGAYVNRHVTNSIRATVLSVVSSVSSLAGIVSLAVFGLLIGALGLLSSLLMLGVVSLGLGLLSYLRYAQKIS